MTRLQMNLSATHDALIENIMEMTGLRTKTEVVENALMLLGWGVTETARGLTIAAVDEEHKVFRQVVLPALTAVAQKKAAAARSLHKGAPGDIRKRTMSA